MQYLIVTIVFSCKQNNEVDLPIPATTFNRLTARACTEVWDIELSTALQNTTLGRYRTNSSQHPWARASSRDLDVALTRLRIGHTGLAAHLHRLSLIPDPYCQWCRNEEDTITHLFLSCPRFHSQRTYLKDQLRAISVMTFDLPTILGGIGYDTNLRQTILRHTKVFLRTSGQLSRL